ERLAEGHQAAAQQDPQAEDDQPLGDSHGNQEQRPVRQELAEDQQREQDQPERARCAVAAHIFLASAMLNSPRGLNASTIAITRQITNSSACGRQWTAAERTRPTITAPSAAPGRPPRPPVTTTANDRTLTPH